VTVSEYDLELIQRCLNEDKHAWEDLVDRSLRVVLHVVAHTRRSRGLELSQVDSDDLVAEVFLELCKKDYAALRRFKGQSSFTSYLTVVARRVVVRSLGKRSNLVYMAPMPEPWASDTVAEGDLAEDSQLGSMAELVELLRRLEETESKLIQMHHLEGHSYDAISQTLGIPKNSVGPALSRAREKMRQDHLRQQQRRAA